ncbi:MAG: Ig-like domain-containing protein [Reichenbachiella sp.]|uniref:Ig-like domain-containing protein n=1 Tax=Reichenbachiella sp. TaxID=2184521 RepID=UPI0032634B2C
MKFTFPLFLLLISIYVYSCANQGTPTGGPRDTIPPMLVQSIPTNKSINYTGKEFKFTFDERINADKLKNQLLITPHTENKFNIKVRKNEVTIAFDDNFNDSSTYTLNFSDGLVDVTEKNPAVNLSFAFSTGPYIDSIYVNGKITDLYTNEPKEEFIVGLYQISDSLNLLEDKPRYFAKTNEQGQFLIENIKNSYYKILCFKDENRNLILNPESEPHGFLADSIDLITSQDSIRIAAQLINASRFKFIRSKTTGRYFDLQYNKPFISYEITKLDSSQVYPIPPNNRVKSNKVMRFYPTETFTYDADSLGILVSATDSMFNISKDTAYVKFTESSRKPEDFSYNLEPKNGAAIDPILTHMYKFNKPIRTFYQDSIQISYDTLRTEKIADSSFVWNTNMTILTFKTFFDKNYLKKEIDTLLIIYGDTTLTDSLSLSKLQYYSQVKTNQVSLSFPKGTFISVDNDSTEETKYNYKFKSLEEMGSVSGVINTSFTSYTLQLVNTKYSVIDEVKNSTTFSFPFVKPGKYTIRVMIDNDGNGQWSYGNILQNKAPETVYFYPEIFDVRANWQLENIEISF